MLQKLFLQFFNGCIFHVIDYICHSCCEVMILPDPLSFSFVATTHECGRQYHVSHDVTAGTDDVTAVADVIKMAVVS